MKKQLYTSKPDSSGNCSVWSHVIWESYALWKNISGAACAEVQTEFVTAFGYAPPLTRLPTADGYTILSDSVPNEGTKVLAVNGNDVVAYQQIKAGDKDVPGRPEHRRYIEMSSHLLPPSLQHLHRQPYEFWFSTSANAVLFDADPWKYIPAFGGHCTHGIASRGDLTPALLADGRMAFTCVNTTQWVVRNGTLYMNSCGMYANFIKDPEADIRKAHALWKKWFGDTHGPINDACFQDGGRWGGDPIGALIPVKCGLH